MSLSDATENHLLLLLFNNTAWASVGVAGGILATTTAGSFYIGTSTGTLTDTSTQTTTESAYTSYARVAVARSSAGWTVSGTSPSQAANTAAVTFPACTGGSETETYFVIGRDSSSTGEVLWWGALTSSLAMSTGITASFAIGALVATLD